MGRRAGVSRTKPGNVRGAHRFKRARMDRPGEAVWYAYVPGQREISLRTTNDAEAEQRFQALLRSRPARRAGDTPAEASLAEIALAYLKAPHGWSKRTRKSATYRANAFVEAMENLGVMLPSKLTDDALDAWRRTRMPEVSAGTINRDEDVPRKMLRWAAEQTPPLCALTPMQSRARLREAQRDEPQLIPSPAEVAKVVGVLLRDDGHAPLAHAVTVAVSTGFRLEELRRMHAGWIEPDTIVLHPESGPADGAWLSKGYRARRIGVPREVARVAMEFVAVRDATGWRLADGWLNELLERACAIAEVARFTMHDLRRTFATEAVRAGVPITVVQQWLCHRSVTTTQRYLGRYASDAAIVAPTPAALAMLQAMPATVVPMRIAAGSEQTADPPSDPGRKLGGKQGRQRAEPAASSGTDAETPTASNSHVFSGGEGIRTPGGLPSTAVFKTAADARKPLENKPSVTMGGKPGGKVGRPRSLAPALTLLPGGARRPKR